MTDRNDEILKKRLAEGFEQLTPDCWDDIRSAVLSDPDISPYVPEVRHPRIRYLRAAALAAAVFLCVFSFVIKDIRTVTARLYIDVNPSVCLSVNRHGNVVRMDGINEDGRRVAGNVSAGLGRDRALEKVITAIAAEIDNEGFFREGRADVLISLSNIRDQQPEVLEKAGSAIAQYAEEKGLTADIEKQTIDIDSETESAASSMGMSAGKYEYIRKLTGKDMLDADDGTTYAEKSVREIRQTSERPDSGNADTNDAEAPSSESTLPDNSSADAEAGSEEPGSSTGERVITENSNDSSGHQAVRQKDSSKKKDKQKSGSKEKKAGKKAEKKEKKQKENKKAGKKGTEKDKSGSKPEEKKKNNNKKDKNSKKTNSKDKSSNNNSKKDNNSNSNKKDNNNSNNNGTKDNNSNKENNSNKDNNSNDNSNNSSINNTGSSESGEAGTGNEEIEVPQEETQNDGSEDEEP